MPCIQVSRDAILCVSRVWRVTYPAGKKSRTVFLERGMPIGPPLFTNADGTPWERQPWGGRIGAAIQRIEKEKGLPVLPGRVYHDEETGIDLQLEYPK